MWSRKSTSCLTPGPGKTYFFLKLFLFILPCGKDEGFVLKPSEKRRFLDFWHFDKHECKAKAGQSV